MSGKMDAHACICENSMAYFQKISPAVGGGLAGLHTNLDVRNMGMDVQYFSTCYIILTIYFSLYCRDTASRSETNKGAPLKYSYGKCKHFPKHLKCILGVGVEYKPRSRGKRTDMRNPQV